MELTSHLMCTQTHSHHKYYGNNITNCWICANKHKVLTEHSNVPSNAVHQKTSIFKK